jgi:hypothetical protein
MSAWNRQARTAAAVAREAARMWARGSRRRAMISQLPPKTKPAGKTGINVNADISETG